MIDTKNNPIMNKIIKVISKTISFNGLEASENSTLAEDLHLSSLDICEIFVNLETEFGIEIPFFTSKNISIKYLSDYIQATIKMRDIVNNLVLNKTAEIKK